MHTAKKSEMPKSVNGKGDAPRPYKPLAYGFNYDLIRFRSKIKKEKENERRRTHK